MLARRTEPAPEPELRPFRCTRCGEAVHKLYPFPLDTGTRNAELCARCQDAWDSFILDLAHRWHEGLHHCFVCSRPFGDHLFPAASPLGPSCAECGITLAALLDQ